MTTRTRAIASTLVLLAVAGAAVLFAWFGIERKDEAAQARKTAEAKLYAFSPSQVKGLTVGAKGDVTRIVRAGEGWRIEAPVAAEGERAAIDALVDRVATLSRRSAIADRAEGDALARYGLATPRATVTLTLDNGSSESLALGDENAFDGTAFVRTTAGAVALVPGDLKWAVERSTFDLREKRLLPLDENETERVEVVTPVLTYAFARDGGRWRLDAPVKDRGDDEVAGRVLGAVRGLRATAFEPAAKVADTGSPRWRVTLVSRGGGRRTVAIFAGAAAAPGTTPAPLRARLEGSPEVATLPAGATKDLEQDLFALRDKAVIHFERERVASLRFERGGSRFDVRRDAAPAKLAGYLWALSSLKAKAFADETGTKLAEHGLATPALQVTLVGGDGKELGRVSVSAPRQGRTFATGIPATSNGSTAPARIAEIDPAALADLPQTAKDAEEKPSAQAEAKAAPK